MNDEQWKAIPKWEGTYEVSDLGRVRSLDRWIDYPSGRRQFRRGQMLRSHPHPYTGHLLIKLTRGGVVTSARVHALVMLAFVGVAPQGMEVCHNNGDPTDNRATNLRYDSTRQNILDQVRHGTHNMASKTHCKHGHAFDAENTIIRSDSYRDCATCRYERTRRSRERRRSLAA